MSNDIFDSKQAVPNKLLNSDGSIVDLVGNPVTNATELYKSKPAIPNKVLNPDGSYSTLSEIIGGSVSGDIFIVVEELPEEGESNKIYLLVDGEKLIEYIWVNNKWDPVGMVEVDISKYSTTEEMNRAIATALGSLQNVAIYTWDGLSSEDNPHNIQLFQRVINDHAAGKTVIIVRSALNGTHGYNTIIFVFDANASYLYELQEYDSYLIDSVSFVRQTPYTSASHSIVTSRSTRLAIRVDKSDHTQVVQVDVFNEIDDTENFEMNFLDTNKSYSTPYVPLYPGSPATKKYVDDAIADNITQVLGGEY